MPQRTTLGICSTSHTRTGNNPWDCKPWLDANSRGFELLFQGCPTATVTNTGDQLQFVGEVHNEKISSTPSSPFSPFSPGYYSLATFIDLAAPPGYVLSVKTHPRFYLDRDEDFPCAVPGVVETEWWPRHLFVVFKAPPVGKTHIFRSGEPYCVVDLEEQNSQITMEPMTADESHKRSLLDLDIGFYGPLIAKRHKQVNRQKFDNTYKVLSRAFKKGGNQSVEDCVHRHTDQPSMHPKPKEEENLTSRKK